MYINEEFIKHILAEELFGYSISESSQDIQIVNYLYNRLLLEKLLYGEPISVPELRKLLRKKIVNFEFVKLNGEIRPAKGTTMMKYIPPKDHPKGIRPSSPKVATFFDLDKDAWRSVSRRSKELVLKKDEETDKPIIVVKDKTKVKVKPVSKERESKDPIEQGKFYKYTTNRGTNTHIEILRELPNGLFQVSSPMFKTTFAIGANRIGDEFTPEPDEKVDVTDVDVKTKEPKEEKPLRTNIEDPDLKTPKEEKPKEPIEKPTQKTEPIVKPSIPPIAPISPPKEEKSQIILPKEVEQPEDQDTTKSPPADITPPPEEDEGPEELQR